MAYEVFLPKLGANMSSGIIGRWYAEEGNRVDAGDLLFELVTDKAVVDVEAEKKGVLKKIIVGEGESVPVVTTVAVIADFDEDISDLLEEIKNRRIEPEKEKQAEIIDISFNVHEISLPVSGRVKASPKARKIAREVGIDISLVKSKEGGFVSVEDVENYIGEKNKRKKCVIIGAGEYSGVIREIFEIANNVDIAGYIDDNKAVHSKDISGISVLGGTEILGDLKEMGIENFIVSVGAPVIRASLFLKAVESGLEPISAIHPLASVSKSAKIEPGAVVEAFSVIAIRSRVGRGVFVTQNCSVSHDCELGEFSHLAPGCHLGGSVAVGRGVLIGVGCAVAPHLSIGDNTIITPGSSVDRQIPANIVVEGCPGRIIGKKTEAYRLGE